MALRHRPILSAVAVVASFALVASAPTASAATSGFSVSPAIHAIDVSSDEKTHRITITNHSAQDATYTLTKEDYRGDRDDPRATPVLLGGKRESSISGYDWLSVQGSVSVPAGASRTVDVKVRSTSEATGGRYAAIVVSGPARGARNFTLRSRAAVLFMMNAGGAPPPEIVIRRVERVGEATYTVVYVNEGTTSTTPQPIKGEDPILPGADERTTRGSCTTALPGGSGECLIVDPARIDTTHPGLDGVMGTDDDVKPQRSGNLPVAGPVEQYIEIVGDPDEDATSARTELPTEWAGSASSLVLPLIGIALFACYFLFLRHRRASRALAFDDGIDAV